jgi:hypothetical protein
VLGLSKGCDGQRWIITLGVLVHEGEVERTVPLDTTSWVLVFVNSRFEEIFGDLWPAIHYFNCV